MPYLNRSDARIYWEEEGSGPEPPLLLIMGLGAPIDAWAPQMAHFRRSRPVLAIENRGVGRSDRPPGPYTMAQLAEDARAVLQAADVTRADVMGLSMGGMVAQHLALEHPDRVRRLVLAATTARAGRAVRQWSATLRGLELADAMPPLGMSPGQMLQMAQPMLFSDGFAASHREQLEELFRMVQARGPSLRGLAGQVGAIVEHEVVDRLAAISHPALVLHGTADRLVPVRHGELLADGLPEATFQAFEGAGHALNLEEAEQYNQVVTAFLD